MKRILAVLLIGALALLSACGGGTTTITPPTTPPAPPPSPLVTPIGSSIGNPVSQTIGAAGGTVTAGGVKLEVLAGTLTNATITLQPITDTLNGAGQGIAISSDAAWSKYAKISFPISASDDPEGLGLAVQQADGSWRSLEPVKVDVAAGTVTAALPATARTANAATSSVRPLAALKLTSVVKFKRFYLKPSSATVKVKGTKSFIPYAQVIQNEQKDPNCGVPDPTDDLAPLCKFRQVTREYPFTNDKGGFTRFWQVNGEFGGNSSLGTIRATNSSGATYTAPDKKPSPDTVTVSFQSIQDETFDKVTLQANVKITDDVIQTYIGSLKFNGSNVSTTTYSGQGNLTFNIVEDLPNDLAKYEATGSLQVTTTYPDCTPVTATVPVNGTMIVFDPVRGGQGDPFASKYWFALQDNATVSATAQCGKPPTAQQIPVTFFATTACPEVPTLPTSPKYADIALLESSGSWPCSFNTTTANWSLKAQ